MSIWHTLAFQLEREYPDPHIDHVEQPVQRDPK